MNPMSLHLQGGVIRKKSQWRVRFKAHLLAIEDPEQPGKDISAGSFNIQRVGLLFHASILHTAHPCTS